MFSSSLRPRANDRLIFPTLTDLRCPPMANRTVKTITTTTPALPRPKGAREACPVQTREGEEGREGGGERGAISVLNCILDFSLSAIKSVEKRGREGASRRAAMLCCCGVGIGKRKQCLARSATLFTAQTLSSEFEGRGRGRVWGWDSQHDASSSCISWRQSVISPLKLRVLIGTLAQSSNT